MNKQVEGEGTAAAISTAETTPHSSGYLTWVLACLLSANTVNFMDRQVLAVIQQPLKEELLLTDSQLGLISGLTFAIFFATLGLPVARLVERYSRVLILSTTMFLWSVMTMLCGTAQSFIQLALYRIGIGVGEAGCTPTAHSLIGDYFPPKKRTRALSIYTLGLCIGIFLGATVSGAIADAYGWRAAFLVIGFPGVALALVIRLTLREPARGQSEPPDSRHFGKGDVSAPSTIAVLRFMLSRPTTLYIIAAHTFGAFAIYGVSAFGPSHFARQFDLPFSQIGLITGITGGIFAGIGTLLGGFTTDRSVRRDARYYMWIPVIGLTIAAPLYMYAYMVDDWRVASVLLAFANAAHFTYLAPMFAALNIIMEPRMRATAVAVVLLVSGVLGNGLGPFMVGMMSDVLARHSFELGDFVTLCSGGTPHAAEPIRNACAAASATGLRYAVVGAAAVYLLASLQFVLAGRSVRRDLAVEGSRA